MLFNRNKYRMEIIAFVVDSVDYSVFILSVLAAMFFILNKYRKKLWHLSLIL